MSVGEDGSATVVVVEKGDTLFVTEATNGVTLTPYDPGLDEQIAAGREFMHEFRDTFHQLAK